MINIFSAYVAPLLKDIKNPKLIQEQKLNLDAEAYEKYVDAYMSKPSDEKESDHHDGDFYWPTSIKDTIKWFTFLTIMEHTANIIKPNKWIIHSLIKLLNLFGLRLINGIEKWGPQLSVVSTVKKKQVYIQELQHQKK